MKKAALILLMLLPAFAFAQQQVTKLVRIRYANAQVIARMASMGSNVGADADNILHVIVLKGEPSAVASVEQTIHELDVPSTAPVSKDIEVIVSVIGASNGAELPAAQEMPEAMAPVVKQLRAIFPYKNYQLLSSMLLRSREGVSAVNSGDLKGFASSASSMYSIEYAEASVSSDETKPVIHLRNFRFSAARPIGIGIGTGVDLPEGKKIVVGKANLETGDSALFVVLTARLVD